MESGRSNVRSGLFVLLFLVLAEVVAVATAAQAQSRVVTIAHECSEPFDPAQANMVASAGPGQVFVTRGAISRTGTASKVLVTGRFVIPDGVSKVSVISLLTSASDALFSVVKETSILTTDAQALLDAAGLSSRLKERRSVLESWKTRLAEQSANLQRLQDDADVIVNVGRIITAEDELKGLNDDIGLLSSSLALSQSRLETVKNLPSPPLFARREAELSAELNELSKTLKNTEAAALRKISAASGELNTQLALIEATKHQQIDPLLRELAALRRERVQLERAGQP